MTAERAAWLAAAACAAGLLRDVSVHAWKERPFAALREQRRAGAAFGFAETRLPAAVEHVRFFGADDSDLYDARYALAPRIVARGLEARFAVATDDEREALATGYSPIAREGRVVLLERR